MSNSFGRIFQITTWGESHGPALGVVIDGCPAGLPLEATDISRELARDIPEPSIGTTRRESNQFEILSGVYDGKTLGTPISIMIRNDDVDSTPYRSFSGIPRPGHGDLTWWQRYGWVDPRGGGRASGRECVTRIAAGAVARLLLARCGVSITSTVTELAGIKIEAAADKAVALERVRDIAAAGDTTGGRLTVTASGMPVGIGAPVFAKLQAQLAGALMTIGGVKAIEIGAGAALAGMTGSEANDPISMHEGRPQPTTNRAGGLLGGITTGNDLVLRLAVKPTPTHAKAQQSVDMGSGTDRTLTCHGRHDMNFTPRVGPIAEAMVALVLVDNCLACGLVPTLRWEDPA